ncbi:MAG: YgiQ family radical SAM protein, partial [Betaproteobacteria bacterium]
MSTLQLDSPPRQPQVAPKPQASPKALTAYRPYWAKRFGTSPFLPTNRAEMEALGWDSCDVIIVTGDAYVDHPSFGMAVIGRTLEAQGFRVGIIAQPDWNSAEAFKVLGRPNLYFGVAAGNMDSMINHYTADRKVRNDDAYTPGGVAGKRPDRATLVYTQRCKEAFKDVPVVIGGIEASLRRIAHYDYWQDKVRRSVLIDSKADLLLYGNAERAIVEVTHRLARKQSIESITDVRGTAFMRKPDDPQLHGWFEMDSTEVDRPGKIDALLNPYLGMEENAQANGESCQSAQAGQGVAPAPAAPSAPSAPVEQVVRLVRCPLIKRDSRALVTPRDKTVIRLPAYEQVKSDPALYAHASRVLHLETNPGNARALVQRHGEGHTAREVWINPPPIPLTTAEMDHVFDLPYARSPHPSYADANGSHDHATKIPAWEMIRFSVN